MTEFVEVRGHCTYLCVYERWCFLPPASRTGEFLSFSIFHLKKKSSFLSRVTLGIFSLTQTFGKLNETYSTFLLLLLKKNSLEEKSLLMIKSQQRLAPRIEAVLLIYCFPSPMWKWLKPIFRRLVVVVVAVVVVSNQYHFLVTATFFSPTKQYPKNRLADIFFLLF